MIQSKEVSMSAKVDVPLACVSLAVPLVGLVTRRRKQVR